jgi:hypothetical protein
MFFNLVGECGCHSQRRSDQIGNYGSFVALGRGAGGRVVVLFIVGNQKQRGVGIGVMGLFRGGIVYVGGCGCRGGDGFAWRGCWGGSAALG